MTTIIDTVWASRWCKVNKQLVYTAPVWCEHFRMQAIISATNKTAVVHYSWEGNRKQEVMTEPGWSTVYNTCSSTNVSWFDAMVTVLGHINKVKLRWARLVLWVNLLAGVPSRYLSKSRRPTQPTHPSCVGAMSTGVVSAITGGRSGEFCVAVGPVTRTDGVLAYCVLA